MRLIIEARFDDGDREAERDGSTIAATVDRRDTDLSKLGLTLAEGRSRRPGASHGFARSLAKILGSLLWSLNHGFQAE